jgi:hypothetical protein
MRSAAEVGGGTVRWRAPPGACKFSCRRAVAVVSFVELDVGGGQVGGGGDLLLFDAKRGAFGVEHGEEVDGAGLVFLTGEGGGVAGGGGGGGERGESLRLAADGREGRSRPREAR